MSDQIILGADENGNLTGEYMPRMEGHTGEGKRHLGITILLYNSGGKILSQKRKHLVFDDVWCFTADTHLLHRPDETNETIQEATKRCLEVEYGILEPVIIKNLGGYNYSAPDGEYCENEYCLMIVGEYNGDLKLNPLVGYEYKWISKAEFLQDVEQNPQKYAPWVAGGIAVLKQAKFF